MAPQVPPVQIGEYYAATNHQQWYQPGQRKIPQTEVNFIIKCDRTRVGDRVAIVGNIDSLGEWNPSRAIYLETTP